MGHLEGEMVNPVLAEARPETPCPEAHRVAQAVAHKAGSSDSLWICQLHEKLALVHLLKDFTDVSSAGLLF